MTTPDVGPATPDGVADRLGMTTPDDLVGSVVAAVNAFVRRVRTPDRGADGAEVWAADVTEGATMLAARLHRRRNSPAGVESYGELGPTYVQRNDPDVAMLIGLGSWRRLAVG